MILKKCSVGVKQQRNKESLNSQIDAYSQTLYTI